MKSLRTLLLLLSCAAASVSTGLSAQNYLMDNPDNHPYFGARVGVDISSAANGGGYYSNQAGFSVGAVYNIPLWRNLYFEPGLSFFYDTFGTVSFQTESADVTPPTGGDPQHVEKLYQVDGSLRNCGFRIPLNIGYHFDFAENMSVQVFTGPQLNISFLARYHRPAYFLPITGAQVPAESEGIFGTGGFKHFDAQWNFGVGFTYDRYYVAVTGSVGMTRLCDETELIPRDIRRNLVTISLGYNF